MPWSSNWEETSARLDCTGEKVGAHQSYHTTKDELLVTGSLALTFSISYLMKILINVQIFENWYIYFWQAMKKNTRKLRDHMYLILSSNPQQCNKQDGELAPGSTEMTKTSIYRMCKNLEWRSTAQRSLESRKDRKLWTQHDKWENRESTYGAIGEHMPNLNYSGSRF